MPLLIFIFMYFSLCRDLGRNTKSKPVKTYGDSLSKATTDGLGTHIRTQTEQTYCACLLIQMRLPIFEFTHAIVRNTYALT